jgi:hypothetical protein
MVMMTMMMMAIWDCLATHYTVREQDLIEAMMWESKKKIRDGVVTYAQYS